MKDKIIFGIDIPTTAAMKDELKKITNIKDFLKRNKKNMIDRNLTDHLNQILAAKDIIVTDVVCGSYLTDVLPAEEEAYL